jgi:putative transposase
MRDRRRYLHWVFEAKKRVGLCVPDYVVTSNHIHLLARDTGPSVIAESMQLIAGCMAQHSTARPTANALNSVWHTNNHKRDE